MKQQIEIVENLFNDAKSFLEKKKKLPAYDVQESVLKHLIEEYPDHKIYEAVSTKAKLLNLFYSTGIQAIDTMVSNIMRIENIDNLLVEKTAVPQLVHEIAKLKLSNNKERDNYSFATKYCALHQPNKYPIYDSVVAAVLVYLMKSGKLPPYQYKTKQKDKSTDFYMTQGEFEKKMHDYEAYVQIYNSFMQAYGLTKLSYREVDWYLWGSFKDGSVKTRIEELAPISPGKYYEYKQIGKIKKNKI